MVQNKLIKTKSMLKKKKRYENKLKHKIKRKNNAFNLICELITIMSKTPIIKKLKCKEYVENNITLCKKKLYIYILSINSIISRSKNFFYSLNIMLNIFIERVFPLFTFVLRYYVVANYII